MKFKTRRTRTPPNFSREPRKKDGSACPVVLHSKDVRVH